MVGWCNGPGITFSAGPSRNLIIGQGLIALAMGAGGALFGYFYSPVSFMFFYSLSLEYCLEGPLNLKQPTNHLGIWMTY